VRSRAESLVLNIINLSNITKYCIIHNTTHKSPFQTEMSVIRTGATVSVISNNVIGTQMSFRSLQFAISSFPSSQGCYKVGTYSLLALGNFP
jgi:hypothetical protein